MRDISIFLSADCKFENMIGNYILNEEPYSFILRMPDCLEIEFIGPENDRFYINLVFANSEQLVEAIKFLFSQFPNLKEYSSMDGGNYIQQEDTIKFLEEYFMIDFIDED